MSGKHIYEMISLLLLVLVPNVRSTNLSANTISYASFCGGIFDGKEIYIKSPNYPDKYPSNLECYYMILGEQCSKYYNIEYLDFNLEDSTDCENSSLQIGNQTSFCGAKNGTEIHAANNGSLQLEFRSKNSSNGKGFFLLITRLPCQSEILKDVLVINSTHEENVSNVFF